MDAVRALNHRFWDEDFWTPPNVTWKLLERGDDGVFLPSPRDMWIPLPVALVLFALRVLWERIVALPIGRWHKLPERTRRAQPNQVLEQAFSKSRFRPNKHALQSLAKQTDWTERKIERWWRIRRSQDKPGELQRFAETSWRFVVYTSFFFFGLYVLWDKPWLWNTKECWYGWPRQHVGDQAWWYYMLELGFYWSLVFTLFIDMKRKDFTMQLVHHFATIGIMVLSWSLNFVRVGTLVLLVHDIADPFLELARTFNYLKYNKISDAIFVMFVIVWFSTRVTTYPLVVMKTTAIESISILGFCGCYYVFNGILMLLLLLHIIWSWMILRLVKEYIIDGKVTDIESDAELSDSSEEENSNTKQPWQQENGVLHRAVQNGVTSRHA